VELGRWKGMKGPRGKEEVDRYWNWWYEVFEKWQ
jgi:hypothetical protein